jgi:hypothetical protein
MTINTTRIAGTAKTGLSFKIVERRPILITTNKTTYRYYGVCFNEVDLLQFIIESKKVVNHHDTWHSFNAYS